MMSLADLLKELRLLKGQRGYRYCMAWLVVLTHLLVRPTLVFLALWVIQRSGDDTTVGKAISALMPIVIRAVGRYLQST